MLHGFLEHPHFAGRRARRHPFLDVDLVEGQHGEALRLFPAMRWGEPDSVGHYFDLSAPCSA